MAEEKDKGQGQGKGEAGRPETAEELLARAAALLEQRGGARAKSYRSAAAKVRAVREWLEGLK